MQVRINRVAKAAYIVSWRSAPPHPRPPPACTPAQTKPPDIIQSVLQVLGNQWVSFDLPQTLFMKIQAAKALGLGGLMLWAADLDDADHTIMHVSYGGLRRSSHRAAAQPSTALSCWRPQSLLHCYITQLMKTQADPGPFNASELASLPNPSTSVPTTSPAPVSSHSPSPAIGGSGGSISSCAAGAVGASCICSANGKAGREVYFADNGCHGAYRCVGSTGYYVPCAPPLLFNKNRVRLRHLGLRFGA